MCIDLEKKAYPETVKITFAFLFLTLFKSRISFYKTTSKLKFALTCKVHNKTLPMDWDKFIFSDYTIGFYTFSQVRLLVLMTIEATTISM